MGVRKMSKIRIIERVFKGNTKFVIQQRHFLFNWCWVDVWINIGAACENTFNTLDEAKQALYFFDSDKTQITEKIVYEK